MPSYHQIIFCTFPDKEIAESIAHLLLNAHLAACINILPNITSVYRWQDQIKSTQEYILIIKARKSYYERIETFLKNHHPYELPEIIAVSIENGLPEYLRWIDSCHFIK
ncbi:MAG: divalent-cation tolerance protein CutA [Methylococcales bacterium]|jgi:periplasmic divalent cation tolerance protein